MRAGRKVRTPQSSVLANGQDLSGLFRLRAGRVGQVRTVPQKIYRPVVRRGKGEMVRLLRELNVRAHRPDGDGRGRANPTWSKTK